MRINISESLDAARFEEFALAICNQRISQIHLEGDQKLPSMQDLLPGLSAEEEAELLGVRGALDSYLSAYPEHDVVCGMARGIPDLELYLAFFWAEGHNIPVTEVLEERRLEPKKWATRYENYKHSLLFTLRRKKAGIRKYYAGWRTFVQLSGSNIRYLLELVDRTLALHAEGGGSFGGTISVETQTKAAQAVGRKNVSELEGLAANGAQLTKLVLSLGRVFQIFAQELEGRRPEVNQFHVSEQDEPLPEADELLRSAIMHLALVRETGTKPTDEAEVRAYDYGLHPIFAPFFVFSYRRKRKIYLSPSKIIGLVRTSKETIREILRDNEAALESPLPEQLGLFSGFYGNVT